MKHGKFKSRKNRKRATKRGATPRMQQQVIAVPAEAPTWLSGFINTVKSFVRRMM